ncbi:hypothetical protein SDRG_05634 [Saprolegnia diclina VS20]|uniref:Uncharacterized protein n=1 Tax=Saprolegnia diclina (strain VS20) TaxID=1156394 RepID=T0QPX6_SAPDV|nr:hypothetical protein SDRG_05634 [Saprolegnia diclina VS20]EQC36801.1 hypothetical protein SDRG_05634 [Saprolegnia diclina VS20]|eukprot:XP_008609582.1 hypothetical protein SDRG_05634 [Saprolegnia diclina VS20]
MEFHTNSQSVLVLHMLRANSPPEAGRWRAADKADPGLDVDASRHAKPLCAPRPRRVTSPELIFRDSSLDRCEKEELCAHPDEFEALLGDRAKWHFRSIVQRPDVELTSPPTRAGNPVILDSKFHAFASPPASAFFSRPKKAKLSPADGLSMSC